MKQLLKGGKGDKLNPSDVDQKELKMGIRVEMEHTNDRELATEIALDHLKENPHYYSKLKKSGLADELKEDIVDTLEMHAKKANPHWQKLAASIQSDRGQRAFADEMKGLAKVRKTLDPPPAVTPQTPLQTARAEGLEALDPYSTREGFPSAIHGIHKALSPEQVQAIVDSAKKRLKTAQIPKSRVIISDSIIEEVLSDLKKLNESTPISPVQTSNLLKDAAHIYDSPSTETVEKLAKYSPFIAAAAAAVKKVQTVNKHLRPKSSKKPTSSK